MSRKGLTDFEEMHADLASTPLWKLALGGLAYLAVLAVLAWFLLDGHNGR